jgi:lysophospholipid acyltransferase (LPLAT)-like uncharacterized protein
MPRPPVSPTGDNHARPPFKARLIGRLVATLVGGIGRTLRIEVDDRCGALDDPPDSPWLWTVWHNRMFVVPTVWRKFLPGRSGAVLTSASKDGAILAETLRCFGAGAVRGSSSRGGAKASKALAEWVRAGFDIAITPDGPRGPKYRLAPGVVRLASITGARILPVTVRYENAWRLKSWDRFFLPKPFSKVHVTLREFETMAPELDGKAFEAEQKRLESLLGGEDETTSTPESDPQSSPP